MFGNYNIVAGIKSQIRKTAESDVRGNSIGEWFAVVVGEMDAIVENAHLSIGSLDEVVEQLREVAMQQSVGHLMLLLRYGNLIEELTHYDTKLFAEQVRPKLRNVQASWTDHGWPRPM